MTIVDDSFLTPSHVLPVLRTTAVWRSVGLRHALAFTHLELHALIGITTK
jgi:hypothetical protein